MRKGSEGDGEGTGGSRDALVRKVRFACGTARFLVAVLAALALAPIVSIACFLAIPVEGVTVSPLDGWGPVAGSLARSAIVLAAAHVGQRASAASAGRATLVTGLLPLAVAKVFEYGCANVLEEAV